MNIKKTTVFYFGPINTKSVKNYIGNDMHIAAASRKVVGILYSIKNNRKDIKSVLVSLPIYKNENKFFFKKSKVLKDEIPVIVSASCSSPVLNRFLGMLWFLWVAVRFVKKSDRVIIYNFFPEYFLCVLYLKFCGNPVFLDIEDLPLKKKNIRESVARLSFWILRLFCSEKIICASNRIGLEAKCNKYCVVNGVVRNRDLIQSVDSFINKKELCILFGGAMMVETGTQVLADAISFLNNRCCELNVAVRFYVTGFGDLSPFYKIKEKLINDVVLIDILGELSPDEYLDILKKSQVGLSLKLPESEIGGNTFPSKTIEIAANGLMLVTTPIEDVVSVFGNSALILSKPYAENLADNVIKLTKNINLITEKGAECAEIIQREFSAEIISSRMLRWIYEN